MEKYKFERMLEILIEKVLSLEAINDYLSEENKKLQKQIEEAKHE